MRYLTGTRHEQWRVDLLDADDNLIRPLHEFVGGTYEINANRAIWAGGSVEVAMPVDEDDIDWGQHRLKLWYSPGFEDVRVPDPVLSPQGLFTWEALGEGVLRLTATRTGNGENNYFTLWHADTGTSVGANGVSVEVTVPVGGVWNVELETEGPDGYGVENFDLTVTPEMMLPGYGRFEPQRVWWPRGVFLIGLPEIEYDDETGLMQGSVKIMDKNLVLDQDADPGSFSVDKGDYVYDIVRHLILQAGETNISIQDTDERLAAPIVWEPGTSKLQIINDLLSTINFRLFVDGNGQYQIAEVVPLERRGVAWTFRQGQDSLHIPRWTRSDDWTDTPNRVVMISQGDDENEALMSVAENTNPDSKFSYQRRGNRWITHTETDVQVTSQEVLDNLARMRLGGLATSYANMSVEHAMLDLWPEDRVVLETDVYRAHAEVRSFQVAMKPGALVQATWREIIDA